MRVPEINEIRRIVVGLVFLFLHFPGLNSQQASHYVPSLDSLNRHPFLNGMPTPNLGIFVHWGLVLSSGMGAARTSRA